MYKTKPKFQKFVDISLQPELASENILDLRYTKNEFFHD